MTLSIGIGAFPSRQGLPGVAIRRLHGQFQVLAVEISLRTQKWSSLWTEIVLRRHKAHNEADPFGVGPIRPRSMNNRIMVERHFAGFQDDIRCAGFIDLDLNLFASLQKVVRAARFLMR